MGGKISVENKTQSTWSYCLHTTAFGLSLYDDREGYIKSFRTFSVEQKVPVTFNKTFTLYLKYGRYTGLSDRKYDLKHEYDPHESPVFIIEERADRSRLQLLRDGRCVDTCRNYVEEEREEQRRQERLKQEEQRRQEQLKQEEQRRQEQLKQEEQRRKEQRKEEKQRIKEKIKQAEQRIQELLKEEEQREERLKQEEQRRQEQLKQELLKQEEQRKERLKQEEQRQERLKRLKQLKQEEQRKERLEKMKQELLKHEKQRQEQLKQEEQRQERLKQEEQRQERLKRLKQLKQEEQRRQEQLKQVEQRRQERLKQQEQRRQEQLKQEEQRRQEQLKQEEQRQERLKRLKQEEQRRQEQLKQVEQRRQERLKQEEQRRQERLKQEKQIQELIEKESANQRANLLKAQEELTDRLRGQLQSQQCAQALHYLVENSEEIDVDEISDVEDKFDDLLYTNQIEEDCSLESAKIEDRMKMLQNKLMLTYCNENGLTSWSQFTFDNAITRTALSLREKFCVLEAVTKLTLEGGMESTVENPENKKYNFLFDLLIQLHRSNATLAGNILLSVLESFPELSDSSRQLLRQILFSKIWTPKEIVLFIRCATQVDQKEITSVLHTVQTYGVDLLTVLSAINNKKPLTCPQSLEQDKDVDIIIREMCSANYPAEILSIIEDVLNNVAEELPKYSSFDKGVKGIIESMDFINPEPDSLQRVLIGLCVAVFHCTAIETEDGKTIEGYFPRNTQLAALLMLLMTEHKGCLLEIGTGEGKSCILAMFATIQAVRGLKVDIVTSSPVLARRDHQEWERLFDMFGLSSSVVPPPSLDDCSPVDRDKLIQENYNKQILYGTVGDFVADTLRQEFEKQETRGKRGFELVIVDEVDHMTLDNGVQVTFLSHEASGMRHLEQVLAGIWSMISTCQPIEMAKTGEIQWATRVQHFHEAAATAVGSETSEHFSPIDILMPGLVEGFFTQEDIDMVQKAQNKAEVEDCHKDCLEESRKAIENIMEKLEKKEQVYLLTNFESTLDDSVSFEFYHAFDQRALRYGEERNNCEVVIRMLLLEHGRACEMLSEESLVSATVEMLKSRIQYSDTYEPRPKDQKSDVHSDFLVIPAFLKDYLEDRLPIFVMNALKAVVMTEGREYMIDVASPYSRESERHLGDTIIPVDFRASGVLEKNKRWGDGLQQFLELKHQLAISSLSNVTNYMSNIHFFQRYHNGIFGVTGTLGGKADSDFLEKHYNTSSYMVPTQRHRKVIELPALQVTGGKGQWMHTVSQTAFEGTQRGQVVLVICEDVMTANELQKKMTDSTISPKGQITMYTISDKHNIEKNKFKGGSIIIATNLAGRGTDIKVEDEVNHCGGLFVILTHFPNSRRVEKQVFGRTGRKGNPGMVQLVLNLDELPPAYQGQPVEIMRRLREEYEVKHLADMETNELKEVEMREELFSSFCQFLNEFDKKFTAKEKNDLGKMKINEVPKHFESFRHEFDYHPALNALKESWALWLTLQEERISYHDDIGCLKADLSQHLGEVANKLTKGQSANFYDHIKQAISRLNLHRKNKKCDYGAMSYWNKAENSDKLYRAVSLYNQAYITMNIQDEGYKAEAIKLLEGAKGAVDVYISETTNILIAGLMSITSRFKPHHALGTNFQRQMETRLNIFNSWRGCIDCAIGRLEALDRDKDEAIAKERLVYALLDAQDIIQTSELMALYQYGLGIVFDIERKPKFCVDALICAIIGVCQVFAGILVCALSSGAASQLGFWLISEGVCDMISGVQGMVTGHFDWTEWAISKAISIGMSLAMVGFGRIRKTFSSVGKASKALMTGTKSVSLLGSTTLKQGVKYAVQEVAKQVTITAMNFVTDKALNAAFRNIMKTAFEDSVKSAIRENRALDQSLTEFIVLSGVPKGALEQNNEDFKINWANKSQMRQIVAKLTDDVIPKLMFNLANADQVICRISQIHGRAGNLMTKAGISSGIQKTISYSLEITKYSSALIQLAKNIPTKSVIKDGFVPAFEKEIQSVTEKFGMYSQDGRKDLSEVKLLKTEFLNTISESVLEEFIQACAFHMTAMASHTCRSHINSKVGDMVGNVFGRSDTEVFFQEKKHNYDIKQAMKSPEKVWSDIDDTEMGQYINNIDNSSRPASGLDILVLTQSDLLEGKGVKVIMTDENGKVISEESYSGKDKAAGQITLRLTKEPGDKTKSESWYTKLTRKVFGTQMDYSAHFEILGSDGKVIPVNSENQDCLYHAIAQATGGHRGDDEIKMRVAKLREGVKEEITQNLPRYANAVTIQMGYDVAHTTMGKYTIQGGFKKVKYQDQNGSNKDQNRYEEYLRDISALKDIKLNEKLTEYDIVKEFSLGCVEKYDNIENLRENITAYQNVEADHIPPKDAFKRALDILERDPQAAAMLKEKNRPFYDMVKSIKKDPQGKNLHVMQVLYQHHRSAQSTGNSKDSQGCRQMEAQKMVNGDVVDVLKMGFVTSYPPISVKLREEAECDRKEPKPTRLSEKGTNLYYKAGFKEMVHTYYKDGMLKPTEYTGLLSWVEQERYSKTNTRTYKTLCDTMRLHRKNVP